MGLTLGSLFDGIAGFPLAASRQGIETIWTSEIEENCIDISTKHFPQAIRLGDITKINGAEIPPVDIISFGSPCQDLSVAGKQAGLSGSRSGLFLEAVRIIREMRAETNGEYPKYIIWENVAGLFRAIRERTSGGSLKRSQKAIFQCLQVESGRQPEWLELGDQGGIAHYSMEKA